MEREPLGSALTSILLVLDCVVAMANQPEEYDEVAAEKIMLGRILSRVQLILSAIEARETKPGVLRRIHS